MRKICLDCGTEYEKAAALLRCDRCGSLKVRSPYSLTPKEARYQFRKNRQRMNPGIKFR